MTFIMQYRKIYKEKKNIEKKKYNDLDVPRGCCD